jgi:hypothetical protein
MRPLWTVFLELADLFVDDGSLALQIVTVIVMASISSFLFSAMPFATGGILLFGCLGALFVNVFSSWPPLYESGDARPCPEARRGSWPRACRSGLPHADSA